MPRLKRNAIRKRRSAPPPLELLPCEQLTYVTRAWNGTLTSWGPGALIRLIRMFGTFGMFGKIMMIRAVGGLGVGDH